MSPRKPGSDALFYVLLYLVLFFAAAGVSSQVILRGELITLPDFTGRAPEEARAALISKKIQIAIRGSRFDPRVEKGRILAQDPPKGSRVKPRRVVFVDISEGNEQVSVPRLIGRSLEAAGQTLRGVGLRRGRISQIHTPLAAAGRILSQDPPEGATVARGSGVDFLVSQGDREDAFVMPDLITRNARSAIARLRELEFPKLDVHSVYYDSLGPGIVIKQFPTAGSRILKRNQITLEVSR